MNRDQFIKDLFHTAGDGFANSGLPVYEWEEEYGPEQHFLIKDSAVDNPSEFLVKPHVWKVTTKTVERGLERIMEASKDKPIKHMPDKQVVTIKILDLSDGEYGDYDAVDAMAIVEVGLWGEVVYG